MASSHGIFLSFLSKERKDIMIRKYQFGDQKQIAELFYTTVQTVNAKDYSQEQLAAWTKGNTDPTIWQQRLAKNIA